jgi:hypothetical protein
MTRLDEVAKENISKVLDSTYFKQHGFTMKFDEANNPLVAISYSSSPEYQFFVHSSDKGEFTTSERPGIHSDETETFQRSDFETCINAVKEWAKRIDDRETDWIMDEFGGVADRNPAIPIKQSGKDH